ncbi:hypothetical protein BGZ58_009374, partial [Dissophora ornata]
FQQHLATHSRDGGDKGKVNDVDQGGNGNPEVIDRYTCSTCQKVYVSLEQFDRHLDGHEEVVLDNSAQDSLDDENETALSDISAKRLQDDPIIEVRPIKRRAKGANAPPVELKVALAGHRLGDIVETDGYEPVEPYLYLADFSARAGEIARTFAGALLQSDSSVILLLKVEVYGRSPSEDIHGFDLAKPTWDIKTVVATVHDCTRKLLIGTLSYSVLVTAALDITTGVVSVGASTSLHISSNMRMWCRKDRELNPLVERQLRSKFDHAITFAKTAAIFYLFASWECHPVTIFRLLDHYRGKSSSGTKAVATLFNEITKTQCITRILLQDLLEEIGAGDCSVATTLRAVLANFKADEQERPLFKDQKTSRLLRSLADSVCGTIRSLNNDKVATAIKARFQLNRDNSILKIYTHTREEKSADKGRGRCTSDN